MRVLLTGATGTIGREMSSALLARGDEVVVLSRDPGRARDRLPDGVQAHAWHAPADEPPPAAAFERTDAVVNLLGEPLAQRWSQSAKQAIRDSRVLGTRSLVKGLSDLRDDQRPRTLVSQSAVGYYGPSDDRELDENAPAGADFLATVVKDWEDEARAAAGLMRVVVTRTGVVLAPDGGALAKMLPFFRMGIGGPVAGGRQYVPWIHLEDVVGALIYAIDEERAQDAVNVTAPAPVTNAELSKALGRALKRPAVLPVPAFALRALYGEMAIVVTTGQRAMPRALERLGYRFRHPQLHEALADVLAR